MRVSRGVSWRCRSEVSQEDVALSRTIALFDACQGVVRCAPCFAPAVPFHVCLKRRRAAQTRFFFARGATNRDSAHRLAPHQPCYAGVVYCFGCAVIFGGTLRSPPVAGSHSRDPPLRPRRCFDKTTRARTILCCSLFQPSHSFTNAFSLNQP